MLAYSLVVLSGCSKTTRLIKDPEPLKLEKPLGSASDGRIVATLDWVIIRNGPGIWAKNADWDEYLLRFKNISGSPIQITNVWVYDSLGTQIDSRPDRKKLIQGSKETKRRYADSDIKVVAGAGFSAMTTAGLAGAGALGATAAMAGSYGGLYLAIIAAPLVPIIGLTALGRNSRAKKVGKEIIRRQTVLPIEIPPSQELPVDLFFPVAPSPIHIEIIYTDTEGEYRLVIDTQEALNGLHLVVEIHKSFRQPQ